MHSFMCSTCNIHSSYFYSASFSQLLLRGAPDTAWILCRSFMPKRHRQLQVKDLSKVPTWRLERDSNPRPLGRKATNLLMRHQASQYTILPRPNPLIGWTCLFPVPGPLWLNGGSLHPLVPLYGVDFPLQSVPPSSLVVYPPLSLTSKTCLFSRCYTHRERF